MNASIDLNGFDLLNVGSLGISGGISLEDIVGYAEEWANKAEDSLISIAAGGDGVDDFSSLHWSIKASADAVLTAADAISTAADAAQASIDAASAASSAADAAQNAIPRNILWQGPALIWQRGISFNSFASRKGVADGWSFARSSFAANSVVSQQAGDTRQYAVRVQRSSSDTSTATLNLVTNMSRDDIYHLAGQDFTLRLRARAGANYSAASSALAITVRYTTATTEQVVTLASGQYSSGDAFLSGTSPTLTTSWQDISHSFTLPVDATQMMIRYQFLPVGTAGAADYFEIEDATIVLGNVAVTPVSGEFDNALERATQEYRTTYAYGVSEGIITDVGALKLSSIGNATEMNSDFSLAWLDPMRAIPTVAIFSPDTGDSGKIYNVTFDGDISGGAVNVGTNSLSVSPSVAGTNYLEGTWTPVLGSVTVTYVTQTGRFTQHGNLMYIESLIDYNTLDTADPSVIQILGLPEPSDNFGFGNFSFNLSTSTGFNFAVTDFVQAVLAGSGDAVWAVKTDGVNWTYNSGKINAAGIISFSGTYRVDNPTAVNEYSVHVVAEARL
jgi:hypothetical protein